MRSDPNALATFAAVVAEASRAFPRRHDAAVLDAGCGDGQLLGLLRDAGFRDLTGLAYDDQPSASERVLAGFDLNRAGWAARLDRRFDLLISTDVIEHLANPLQFLREMAAVANPGALLMLTFPNVHNLRSIIGYALQGRPSGFFGPNLSEKPLFDQHVWMPNEHVVNFFLRETGFMPPTRLFVHGRGRLFTQTTMVLARRRADIGSP
jgi:SAM-dependent methyltransferase